jgi:chorismate mutase
VAEKPALAQLRRVRSRIDSLDRRIVGLLNERARLGLAAGAAKAARGEEVRDLEREADVLRRVCEANEGPLPAGALLAIYRRLMAATRRLEASDRRSGHRRGEDGRGASGAEPSGTAGDGRSGRAGCAGPNGAGGEPGR